MCGFAGVLSTAGYNADHLTGHARRMIAPIAHRGPDDSGIWVDERAGIALGFRRLAILDLSPLGHQPMQSPSGRFVIAFNGEIYNFRDLRRELEPHGYTFRGHSDTEVILACFERWGIDQAVRRFVGMFAIAVWDTHRRELSLIRDRLGKKPLYVYSEPGCLTFGSELKALVAGPSFNRSIDHAALASYFRYLFIPAPKTIFRGTVKLPAAHILTVRDASLPLPDPVCYWSLREAALAGLANPLTRPDEALEGLDALLSDAVRCRLQSDVPLGALLSGGIDSSIVVALMQEASNRSANTYTIGFVEEAFDEAAHASRVARHLGTDHTELLLTGEDARSLVPRLPEIFDEPFADPSQLPTLLVSHLARQQVTVALSGDGGDELFGGYNRYVYGAQMLPRLNLLPSALRQPIAAGIGNVPAATWDALRSFASSMLPWVPQEHFGDRLHKLGRLMNAPSVGEMYRSLLSAGWQHPEDLLAEGHGGEDATEQIVDGREPRQLLDRMMLADQMTYLPDDLLAKLDRASMAASLEVRAPLLDHRVVEYSWRLPREMKLRGQVGKWALRQVLYRRVPKEIIERPKMGFSVPIGRWLRGPLRTWAEDLVFGDGLRASGLFDMSEVSRVWKKVQEGHQSAGTPLWAIVMFLAWKPRWQV